METRLSFTLGMKGHSRTSGAKSEASMKKDTGPALGKAEPHFGGMILNVDSCA